MALYRTLTVGVMEMFHHPDLPPPLMNMIREHFKKHQKDYLARADGLAEYEGKKVECFHGAETVKYRELRTRLDGKI